LACDPLERQALLERLERAEDLLRSLTDCLARVRARLLNVIDREGIDGKVRSDLVVSLGRVNMAIRISDELRTKTIWRLKEELRKS
jgi:hypothetical protein